MGGHIEELRPDANTHTSGVARAKIFYTPGKEREKQKDPEEYL
jgi:hypothetical protein